MSGIGGAASSHPVHQLERGAQIIYFATLGVLLDMMVAHLLYFGCKQFYLNEFTCLCSSIHCSFSTECCLNGNTCVQFENYRR